MRGADQLVMGPTFFESNLELFADVGRYDSVGDRCRSAV